MNSAAILIDAFSRIREIVDRVPAGLSSEQLAARPYDDGNTIAWVRQLADADLDRVVDESWTPHVTLGIRLVSVISDDLQHAGQAAYLRGMFLA